MLSARGFNVGCGCGYYPPRVTGRKSNLSHLGYAWQECWGWCFNFYLPAAGCWTNKLFSTRDCDTPMQWWTFLLQLCCCWLLEEGLGICSYILSNSDTNDKVEASLPQLAVMKGSEGGALPTSQLGRRRMGSQVLSYSSMSEHSINEPQHLPLLVGLHGIHDYRRWMTGIVEVIIAVHNHLKLNHESAGPPSPRYTVIAHRMVPLLDISISVSPMSTAARVLIIAAAAIAALGPVTWGFITAATDTCRFSRMLAHVCARSGFVCHCVHCVL